VSLQIYIFFPDFFETKIAAFDPPGVILFSVLLKGPTQIMHTSRQKTSGDFGCRISQANTPSRPSLSLRWFKYDSLISKNDFFFFL